MANDLMHAGNCTTEVSGAQLTHLTTADMPVSESVGKSTIPLNDWT